MQFYFDSLFLYLAFHFSTHFKLKIIRMKKLTFIFLLTIACFSLLFMACPFARREKVPLAYDVWGEIGDKKVSLHITKIPQFREYFTPILVDATDFEVWISDKSLDSLTLVDTVSVSDDYVIPNLENGKKYFIRLKFRYPIAVSENEAVKDIQVVPNILEREQLYTPEINIPFDSIHYKDYFDWNHDFSYVSYLESNNATNYTFQICKVSTQKSTIISNKYVFGSSWNNADGRLIFSTTDSVFTYHPSTKELKTLFGEVGTQYYSPTWSYNGAYFFYHKRVGSVEGMLRCDKDGTNSIGVWGETYFSRELLPNANNTQLYLMKRYSNENNAILLVDILNNEVDTLCLSKNSLNSLAISPDGNKLAIESDMSGRSVIWVYDIPNKKWLQTDLQLAYAGIKFNDAGTALLFFNKKNTTQFALYRLPIL